MAVTKLFKNMVVLFAFVIGTIQVSSAQAAVLPSTEIWTARMQMCAKILWDNQTWEFTSSGQLQV